MWGYMTLKKKKTTIMQILPNGHNVVVSNAWLIFTNVKPIHHFIAPECRILLIQ